MFSTVGKSRIEVSEVYENFSDELEEKERTIEKLNNRIMALQAEKQGLRAKYEQITEITAHILWCRRRIA